MKWFSSMDNVHGNRQKNFLGFKKYKKFRLLIQCPYIELITRAKARVIISVCFFRPRLILPRGHSEFWPIVKSLTSLRLCHRQLFIHITFHLIRLPVFDHNGSCKWQDNDICFLCVSIQTKWLHVGALYSYAFS